MGLAVALLAVVSSGLGANALEYRVKASSLYNFFRFAIEGGKVRLEVNLASARRAGLKISSKLLEVASEVYR
jgi:hypothetical protein